MAKDLFTEYQPKDLFSDMPTIQEEPKDLFKTSFSAVRKTLGNIVRPIKEQFIEPVQQTSVDISKGRDLFDFRQERPADLSKEPSLVPYAPPKQITPKQQKIESEANLDAQLYTLADDIATVGFDSKEDALKTKAKQDFIISRAPMIATGMASPIAVLAFEGFQQIKNIAVANNLAKEYSPTDTRQLTDILPEDTPQPLRLGLSVAEMVGDVALVGTLLNLSEKGLFNSTMKEVSKKMADRGYSKEDIGDFENRLKNVVKGSVEKNVQARFRAGEWEPPVNVQGKTALPGESAIMKPEIPKTGELAIEKPPTIAPEAQVKPTVSEMPVSAIEQSKMVIKPEISPKSDKMIEIPKFKNTEEAQAFGIANKNNLEILAELQKRKDYIYNKDLPALRGKDDIDSENEFIRKSTEAQLYREAIEAGKTLKSETTPLKGQTEPIPTKKTLGNKIKKEKVPIFKDKEQLLIDVQKAIEIAPSQKSYLKEGQYEIDESKVPLISFKMDGGAKIYNTKEALTEFYNKVKKTPESMTIPEEPKKLFGKQRKLGEEETVKNDIKTIESDLAKRNISELEKEELNRQLKAQKENLSRIQTPKKTLGSKRKSLQVKPIIKPENPIIPEQSPELSTLQSKLDEMQKQIRKYNMQGQGQKAVDLGIESNKIRKEIGKIKLESKKLTPESGVIANPAEVGEATKKYVDKKWIDIRENIEDDWIRVKKLVQQKGAKVDETNNPYEAEIRYWGRVGSRMEETNDEITNIDKEIAKIENKFKSSTVNKDVDRYLIAKHTPERNAVHGEKASGYTNKEAEDMVSEIENKPYSNEVKVIADRVKKLNKNTLDILLEGEIISKELYDSLRKTYPNHIPLNRVMDENEDIVQVLTKKGFDVQGAGIKRAFGSEKEVSDILSNVTANIKGAIARAEKNIVDLHTVKFAKDNDYFDGLFEKTLLPMRPVGKVEHRAAVDREFLGKLSDFAEKIGGRTRTAGQISRKLGYYSGGTATRHFGTPIEVQSHEVAHLIDDKFGLKQRFYKRGQTKAVTEEILKLMERRNETTNRKGKPEERFADAFEWWLIHRDLAKRDYPLFSKEMKNIINDIPDLKSILNIEPTPGDSVETMEELMWARDKFNTDPTILPYREKGEQKYLKINDPQIAVALRGVNRQKVDGLLKIVGAFTRTYAGLMTRFNPEFSIPNLVRDIQETIVYLASKNEVGAKGAVKTALREPSSVKAIVDSMLSRDTEGARLYKELKMEGGTTGGLGLSTKEQIEIDINKIRAINRSTPRKAAEIALKVIDNWNRIFEDSTRLSVYKQALSQGVSKKKAAVLAKEASINFNKMGTASPVIQAGYMFANPSVQGSAKMLRAMKNPKVAGIVLLALGGSIYALNEYNDNIDKDWRSKISKWDKLNGLNIMIPTNKGARYITIPISWGLKPLKVGLQAAIDFAEGHETDIKRAFGDVLVSAIEGFNPVGGTDIVSAALPTILDLPVEIARNRSWTGGKIRPDWNQSAPDSIKYFDSLKNKAIGRKFIEWTRKLGDKGIEISPADMKYAFDSYIGGTGRFTEKMFETISGVAKGEKVEAKKIPFLSRFYRDVPEEQIKYGSKEFEDIKKLLQKQDKERFYLNQEAELVYEGMKNISKEQAKNNYSKIKESNPELAKKIKDIAEDDKYKLDYTKRLIKQLGVENGERAKYIWQKVQAMDTKEEKKTYLKNLREKKIISDRVKEQLMKIGNRKRTLGSAWGKSE